MIKEVGKKKFLFDINYNRISESCIPCKSEAKKIDKKINGRKLSSIKKKRSPTHLKNF